MCSQLVEDTIWHVNTGDDLQPILNEFMATKHLYVTLKDDYADPLCTLAWSKDTACNSHYIIIQCKHVIR